MRQQLGRHLLNVFHWTPNVGINAPAVLAASFGHAGPVLVGHLSGHNAAGFVAALGGLAVGAVENKRSLGAQARLQLEALMSILLATVLAIGIANSGLPSAAMLIGVATIAAFVGGLRKAMTVASTRFIIFFTIINALPDLSLPKSVFLLLTIVSGAVWMSALNLCSHAVALCQSTQPLKTTEPPRPSLLQKPRDSATRLKSVTRWRYTVQLGSCLSVASILQWAWPHHHFHWIGLTIALLTSRRPEASLVKTTQRILGTAAGVTVAAMALSATLSIGLMLLLVSVLAGTRDYLNRRNYLAYSGAMTLLVVVYLDHGQGTKLPLLADRMLATFIGAMIVGISGYLLRRLFRE